MPQDANILVIGRVVRQLGSARGRPEPAMTVARTVAEILEGHVTLELEGIDRMYLNLYVPLLQTPGGVAHYWRRLRGYQFGSSTLMGRMTRAFVGSIERFAAREGIDLIGFKKRERKEEVAKRYLADFSGEEGVLFIGKAQEKTRVVRTERRFNPQTRQSYPWLVDSTAMVNQYYFYCVDKDFGPFFMKVGSYFPYTGRLCINGHEYLKRQLTRRGVSFEALDNGLLTCEDARLAQRICDGLTAAKIDALARKWLRRLPHPYTREDRRAGIRYEVSMLQTEFSLTQVLDRPSTGRAFFEAVIRDNLDLGRPDRVQLIFGRRILRSTRSRFRTRVITQGVYPSLHVDYKNSRIKQYHKEGRALRTETTINDTYDFAIGRRLTNLPALKEVGFQANRRLLDVQRISHDCYVGEDSFQGMHRPAMVGGQRASALRFGDPRVLAVLSALVLFRLLPCGFRNRDMRTHVAQLLGVEPSQFGQGKMTYELRRLRLHGLIRKIAHSHRYQVTDLGFRSALFLTRAYLRLLRPGLATVAAEQPTCPSVFRRAMDAFDAAIIQAWSRQSVAA